jgi:hypothetical protein
MTTPGQDSRGTAALRQAIATGAPVPTTGEQAKELNTPAPSQRWGVYDTAADRWVILSGQLFNGQPLTPHDADEMCRANSNFEVRDYPAPTPPAKVEGEWKVQHLDIEYSAVTNGTHSFCVAPTDAVKLCPVLNTLAAENARLRVTLTRIALVSNDRVVQELAESALGATTPC